MERLNPDKLHITYLTGVTPGNLILPRCYTLTHSDRTGELFLSIGNQYDTRQVSRLYTKLMRDEVLAELIYNGESLELRVYCHVGGGFVFGTARWRYNIFCSELTLALEAIRYGDRILIGQNPRLDQIPVIIYFRSTNGRFNRVENWGTLAKYS